MSDTATPSLAASSACRPRSGGPRDEAQDRRRADQEPPERRRGDEAADRRTRARGVAAARGGRGLRRRDATLHDFRLPHDTERSHAMNDLDRLAELERGRDAATQYEMKSAHEDAIRLWWKKHAPALLATARRAAKLEKVAEAARAGIAGMKPDDGDGACW